MFLSRLRKNKKEERETRLGKIARIEAEKAISRVPNKPTPPPPPPARSNRGTVNFPPFPEPKKHYEKIMQITDGELVNLFKTEDIIKVKYSPGLYLKIFLKDSAHVLIERWLDEKGYLKKEYNRIVKNWEVYLER